MDRVSQALFSVVATYNDTFFLSFHISVNDLRRLIEKHYEKKFTKLMSFGID